MIEFNLEYYRAFYYVAQLNSITKAANALYLSQPAVTRSIKMIEAHLGCSLFTRTSKGMLLTSEGEALFKHVSKAFEELILGEKEIFKMLSYEIGRLEIGTTETALYQFLLPKIDSFHKNHPKVYAHLTGSSTPEVLQMLQAGTTDLAIVVSPAINTEGLNIINVQDFHDIFLAGSSFTELKNRKITAEEICKYPLVTVEKGTSARRHIDLWFDEQGVLFQPEYTVRTSTMILPFVERNLAIGIIPYIFAKETIQQGHIFQVALDREIPSRQILIIYKDDSQMSLLCKHFINHLCKSDHS